MMALTPTALPIALLTVPQLTAKTAISFDAVLANSTASSQPPLLARVSPQTEVMPTQPLEAALALMPTASLEAVIAGFDTTLSTPLPNLLVPQPAAIPTQSLPAVSVGSKLAVSTEIDATSKQSVPEQALPENTKGLPGNVGKPKVSAKDTSRPSAAIRSAIEAVAEELPVIDHDKAASLPDVVVPAPIVAVVVSNLIVPTKPQVLIKETKPGSKAVDPGQIYSAAQITSPSGPARKSQAHDRNPVDEAPASRHRPLADGALTNATAQRLPTEQALFNLPTSVALPAATPQIVRHLDLARDLAWIGNLAQEIVAASSDREKLSFRLMPQSMGQLDVNLSRLSDGLHVEMTATTELATQIIAAEQPRLIEELRQSGVKVAGADLASGQHAGSQRGQTPPRHDPTFAAHTSSSHTKSEARPDGRFA